jgi:hypothetical protein
MNWQNNIANLVIGILGNLIVLGLIWLTAKIPSSLSRRDPRRPTPLLSFLIILLPIINFALFIYVIINNQPPIWLLATPISFSILTFILWSQLNQFWKVGIRGVDRQIRSGINYDDALKIIKNELKFLGIGASKLTREDEFEKALNRCRGDKSIKFLLCNPSDSKLVNAAKKFNQPDTEYRNNVINSIRKISEIKKKRELNIEVRFYPVGFEPIFRLMFIDSSICLFSYNVWGEGNGSQFPQLHVVNAPQSQRTVESFYYPLELYFDNLWEKATQWNFRDYL